jgi:hypothetical protein
VIVVMPDAVLDKTVPMAYFPVGGARESFFGTIHGQGRDAEDHMFGGPAHHYERP